MYRIKYFLALFFLCFSFSLFAQDIDSRSPKPNAGTRQQQNADKKKAARQKKNDRGLEKARKQHLKLQTKNTRKMMRDSKKKSKKFNDKTRSSIQRTELFYSEYLSVNYNHDRFFYAIKLKE